MPEDFSKAGWFVFQALIGVLFAGLLTAPISRFWHIRKKRREIALETAQHFYTAYGDFFVTWKLWNYSTPWDRESEDEKKSKAILSESEAFDRKTMLERATRAEGHVEAMLVKLVCERELKEHEVEAVAKFRQAYQSLRTAIKHDEVLKWDDTRAPGYVAFKENAVAVCYLISTLDLASRPEPEMALANMLRARDQSWEKTWTERLSKPPDRVSEWWLF